RREQVKPETEAARKLIDTYLDEYLAETISEPFHLRYPNQVAMYEVKKIRVAYLNTVMNNFGNELRRAINLLLDIKQRKNMLCVEIADATGLGYKQRLEAEILAPARQVKLAVASRNLDVCAPAAPAAQAAICSLHLILDSYAADYNFKGDNIYYDAKMFPMLHLKAYWRLAAYIHIDTTILIQNIYNKPFGQTGFYKDEWGFSINLKSKVFLSQKGYYFWGAIETDGVGVSVIKKTSKSKESHCGRQKTAVPVNETQQAIAKAATKRREAKAKARAQAQEEKRKEYVHDFSASKLNPIKSSFIYIDPGRRDLLYCMQDSSTIEHPNLYCYTRNQQEKERKTSYYKRFREKAKKDYTAADISKVEQSLAEHAYWTVSSARFKEYIRAKQRGWDTLSSFYSSYMMNTPGSTAMFHRTLRWYSYINQQKADAKLVRNLSTLVLGRSQLSSSEIKNGPAMDRRIKGITIVLGNWAAGMTKYQEPIRGIGMARLMRKNGFNVLLLDECKTSKTCPHCFAGTLEKFKKVESPRYKNKKPVATDIPFSSSSTRPSPPPPRRRLCNHNVAAVLNFRHIVEGLCDNGEVPERFRRLPAASDPSSTKPAKRRRTKNKTKSKV
ncbi:hypothetical protein EV175_003028, partial [Coemansia sp. RSA 1933]